MKNVNHYKRFVATQNQIQCDMSKRIKAFPYTRFYLPPKRVVIKDWGGNRPGIVSIPIENLKQLQYYQKKGYRILPLDKNHSCK